MTLRTILLLLAFLPFMALTSHVVIIYGFDGFYIEAFQNAATTLLLTDLAISLILIQIWMWFDAKKTGRNPWPYYAITVTIGIRLAMTKPVRRPMKTSSTTMTIATASIRLTMKLLIATVTAVDCSEMIPKSMPSGVCGSSSSMRA